MIALWWLAGALAQDYAFGTSAADYGYFYPTAYYDHGGADWACGNTTYPGHRGNDFGCGGFPGMDAGRDITAAAAGTVIATHDGEWDRCTTGDCGASNNVEIRHADGKVTRYVHLKRWSVAVSVGQVVTCGQYLGLAGSSGYSTGPHLHFEVRSGGVAGDPFDGPCSFPPSWWVSQGGHGGLPSRTCDGPADNCPADPNKTEPGVCGCGTPDSNADGDGALDCQESCDTDPAKTAPGICGCGVSDVNSDGDGLVDCQESCDLDPAKTAPGICGCGAPDTNTDGDALADCQESCDLDPGKAEPGVCGCGVADADGDGDAALDCVETCDADPLKLAPGVCGCGVSDADGDGDGALDCVESCDADPWKAEPLVCGCGIPEEDITGDGVPDCTVCSNSFVEWPETCDDGDRDDGDGCDALCQREQLLLILPRPAVAGAPNTFTVRSVPPGDGVVLLASAQLGSTAMPGCPGLRVPLVRPVLVGTTRGDATGAAAITLPVPARVSGLTFAMIAVDTTACTVSPIGSLSFQ